MSIITNRNENKNIVQYEQHEMKEMVNVLKFPEPIYSALNTAYQQALNQLGLPSDRTFEELIFIDGTETFRIRFKIEKIE